MPSTVAAVLQQFKFAARSLRRTPTLTVAFILTLAVGLGPTTAIFSVVYGVLLRPLPYPDPAALAQVTYVRTVNGQTLGFSIPELSDWTSSRTSFAGLAMYGATSFNLALGPESEVIRGAMVSERFFPLLQPQLVVGRALESDDATRPDAVISAGLWQRRFGSDTAVVGRQVLLDGVAYTVVGVAPRWFQFPAADTDVWIPVGFAKTTLASQWRMRGFRAFSIVGRLAPGATWAEARTDAAATARALSQAFPRFNGDLSATVTPLRDRLTSPVRPALLMLFGAVACVWLIACANLANLALARGATRRQDVAVRAALGARRRDLVAQYLAEGVILGAAGALGGVGLGGACLGALLRLPSLNVPRLEDVHFDLPVLAFAVGLSAVATLVFGVAPLVRSSRARPADALHGVRGVTSVASRRAHQALVVAEVAVAVVLLVGASLFARSLATLVAADTGATAAGVLTMKVSLAPATAADPIQQSALVDRVLAGVTQVPGVVTAGVTSNLPPNLNQMRTSFTLRNPSTGAEQDVAIEVVSAAGDVFGSLGVRLIAGRAFVASDAGSGRRTLILSEHAARAFFPDRDAVGQTLAFGAANPSAPLPLVVGVVGDVKYGGLDAPPDGAIYMPYAQQSFRSVYLAVRTARDPLAVAMSVRRAVLAEGPSVAVSDVKTLDAVVQGAADEPRVRTVLLGSIAALALLMAAVGLYGVISYGVTQRTAEIGLRAALGARRRDVLLMIIRQGMALTSVGIVIGAVAARTGGGLVARFLYGVDPADGRSFVLAIAFVLVVGFVGSIVPARRASAVDPLVAWRTAE